MMWRERILRFDQRLAGQAACVRCTSRSPTAQKLVMVLAIGLALALSWLTWQVRRDMRPPAKDPLVRVYARLCRKMAAHRHCAPPP